jgi:hypothetical protein
MVSLFFEYQPMAMQLDEERSGLKQCEGSHAHWDMVQAANRSLQYSILNDHSKAIWSYNTRTVATSPKK